MVTVIVRSQASGSALPSLSLAEAWQSLAAPRTLASSRCREALIRAMASGETAGLAVTRGKAATDFLRISGCGASTTGPASGRACWACACACKTGPERMAEERRRQRKGRMGFRLLPSRAHNKFVFCWLLNCSRCPGSGSRDAAGGSPQPLGADDVLAVEALAHR